MSSHTFAKFRSLPRPHRSLFGWTRFASRRVPRLDLEGLPEHIKRDLGFGAGRETPPRDLMRD